MCVMYMFSKSERCAIKRMIMIQVEVVFFYVGFCFVCFTAFINRKKGPRQGPDRRQG